MTQMKDFTEHLIDNLNPKENEKTLEVQDYLTGDSKEQLKIIKEKIGEWLERIKNRRLPSIWSLIAYKC